MSLSSDKMHNTAIAVAVTSKAAPLPLPLPASSSFVVIVQPNDVVLGRGGPAVHHEGNIRFRNELIAPLKKQYKGTMRHQKKHDIALQVMDAMKKWNGQFLVKIQHHHLPVEEATTLGVGDGAAELYTLATDNVAIEKIKQALREKDPLQDNIQDIEGILKFLHSRSTTKAKIRQQASIYAPLDIGNVHKWQNSRHVTTAKFQQHVPPIPVPFVSRDIGTNCGHEEAIPCDAIITKMREKHIRQRMQLVLQQRKEQRDLQKLYWQQEQRQMKQRYMHLVREQYHIHRSLPECTKRYVGKETTGLDMRMVPSQQWIRRVRPIPSIVHVPADTPMSTAL